MTENPYAPPRAPLSEIATAADSAAAQLAMYSPRQIFVASFLGSPLAASWFASRNFRAFSQDWLAQRILLGGFLATAAALALGYTLSERLHVPNTAFPLLYSLLIRWYAQNLFGSAFEKHVQSGGRRGSYWTVVGISLLILVAVLAVIFGCIFAWSYFFARGGT